MDKRKGEIEFVLNTIQRLCNEFNIALVPKETKKRTKYVGIVDTTNNKEYAMIENSNGGKS